MTTTTWTTDELASIGDAEELQLSSFRADGTLRPFATIWVVRAGDSIYIRSAYGADNPWFRRAKESGMGRIHAGGIEADVTFTEPDDDVHADIDVAYHAKYDRHGKKIVDTVVGTHAMESTLRVLPNAD